MWKSQEPGSFVVAYWPPGPQSEFLSRFLPCFIFDSSGFSQNVRRTMHYCLHTLDLILTYDMESEQFVVFEQNPVLPDIFLTTFEVT